MNTYTNVVHPKKKVDQTTRIKSVTIIVVVLALIAVAAVTAYLTYQPVIVAKNTSPIPFSHALEMQYAQPWLDTQNTPVITYGNALELQYAQPWLQKAKLSIAATGRELPIDCNVNLEMLYACKYGYSRP